MNGVLAELVHGVIVIFTAYASFKWWRSNGDLKDLSREVRALRREVRDKL